MVGAREIGPSAGGACGAGVHMVRAGVHCGRGWCVSGWGWRLLRPVGAGGRVCKPVAGGRWHANRWPLGLALVVWWPVALGLVLVGWRYSAGAGAGRWRRWALARWARLGCTRPTGEVSANQLFG